MTSLLACLLAAVAAAASVPGRPRVVRADGPPRPRAGNRGSWMPGVAAAAGGLAPVLLVGGTTGVVAGAVLAVFLWRAVGRMEAPQVRRRRQEVERRLPHAVDLLAACLGAGLAPATAVQEVAPAVGGPLGEELSWVSARLDLGVDPVTVWRDLGSHPQLAPLGRCVARAVDQGASVADAMAHLADDLRRESRGRVVADARAVGVKAALPLGVCMLPAFLLVGVVPLVAGSLSGLLR